MILAYMVLSLVLLVLLFWARLVLRRFLDTHGSIANRRVLLEFKAVARWNMYGALAFLVGGAILLAGGLYLTMEEGLTGLMVVLACSLPSLILSLATKELEERSRALPCPDTALMPEYRQVCETWVKKALPDF